jgi:hypothetical protein
MGNANNVRWTHRHVSPWIVKQDANRQLPCHASVKVRVKVVEPGIQSRWCDRCGEWRYFTLEEMQMIPGTLRFRWLSDGEAEDHERQADGGYLPGITVD